MKNIYDGIVALDDRGEAVIDFPDWFGALNKDFRYRFTSVGLLNQICILQRKFLTRLQTTVAVAAITTTVASRLQEGLQA